MNNQNSVDHNYYYIDLNCKAHPNQSRKHLVEKLDFYMPVPHLFKNFQTNIKFVCYFIYIMYLNYKFFILSKKKLINER